MRGAQILDQRALAQRDIIREIKHATPAKTGSDSMIFFPLYGTTSWLCQGGDREEWFREDMRMLSAVLRQERPAVRERPALSSADSIA